MKLSDLLQKNNTKIVAQWITLVTQSYAPDTARFLTSNKDNFSNPVGAAITTCLTAVFEELLGNIDANKLSGILDPLVRIRAIQKFTPSQAVGFIFELKKIIRNGLLEKLTDKTGLADLLEFELKIDTVASIAFDVYSVCREQLHALRDGREKRIYKAFKQPVTNNGPSETCGNLDP
jgi:hypothetical protein